ncbi:MAG: hypothetical protein Q8O67_14700 [Deltaproteobacteria bacterium]|nr:hypothetical protein [Deltaproteobacteria bacterium]
MITHLLLLVCLQAPTTEVAIGDPEPLALREATLKPSTFELDGRGGLVGTGPARFTADIRCGVLPWLELRTSLVPYPGSFMARARMGSVHDETGAFVVDAGLAHVDLGLRLQADADEAKVGLRAHLEGGLAYERATPAGRLSVSARYRYRLSGLADDEQQVAVVAAVITTNLTPSLAFTGGASWSSTLFDTLVLEPAVLVVEWDRPFFTTALARDEGSTTSVSLPAAFTLSRTESFDIDVFASLRVYPEPGLLLGAGLRMRFGI